MKVLVDTSIWSIALRRSQGNLAPWQQEAAKELAALIGDGRVVLVGPVRQELLSGLAEPRRFGILAEHLRAFPDVALASADWESVATIHNACRTQGIAGSSVDFVLCAVAIARGLELFTADQDFARYAGVVAVKLFAGGVWGPDRR